MNGYSQDLRERIVRAVNGGMSRAEVARRFMVNERTVRRYVRRYETTGSVAPTAFRPGPRPAIAPDREAALRAQLAAAPDATLEEHCARWQAEQGRAVSVSTMCRAQRRVGWTVKKVAHRQRTGPDSAGGRPLGRWREAMADVPVERLVFVDETGTHTRMTPLYARAPRGERALARLSPFDQQRINPVSVVAKRELPVSNASRASSGYCHAPDLTF